MLNEKSIALAKIDNAGTDWEVLDLPVKTNLTTITLKSQYRKLAILVHPDKNDDTIAPRCFIKLQHAYESLLKSTEQEHNLSEQSNKTSTKSNARERQRGEFDDKQDPKINRKRFHAPDSSTEAKFKAFNEIFGDEDLEFHSHSWKKFCDRNADSVGNTAQHVDTVSATNNKPTAYMQDEQRSGTEPAPSTTILPHCCLLCRRQFTSFESFTRHIDHSALHKTNLSKSKLL